MAKRTTVPFVGVTWSERQITQHSAHALAYAIKKAGATQADAAKWCRVSLRTIQAWLAPPNTRSVLREAPAFNLRAVLRSGRLRREFLRYLQVCDRKEAA
jgi:hypothetical protein